jgi:protein TonB
VNRGLIWSGALHGAVFVVFLLGPGPKPFEWDRADAVPVDLVSMPVEIPDPTPPPPEPVVPEPVVQEAPAPEEVVPETPENSPPDPTPVQQAPKPKPPPPKRVFKKYAPPREDDEPSLAERLKQRLEKVADETTPEAPAETAAPAPAAPAENTAAVEVVNFPYEWYLNVLRTKILAAWDPPGERLLTGHRRDVVVRFRIHRDGSITNVRIDGASGTPGLDASAQRAIERGGPYPPLPPAYEEQWLDLGVRFMATKE